MGTIQVVVFLTMILPGGTYAQEELVSTNKLATNEDQPASLRAKNNIFFSAISAQNTDDSTECYQVELVNRGGPMDPEQHINAVSRK